MDKIEKIATKMGAEIITEGINKVTLSKNGIEFDIYKTDTSKTAEKYYKEAVDKITSHFTSVVTQWRQKRVQAC